jgi:hypothetical protein
VPRQIFLGVSAVSSACFIKREYAMPHGGDHQCFVARPPALKADAWQSSKHRLLDILTRDADPEEMIGQGALLG